MKLKLLLCRHGETELNKRRILQGQGVDASLNDTGKAQASALCKRLKEMNVDYLAVTKLKRTSETAADLNMKSVQYKELNEIHWGNKENTQNPDLSDILDQWKIGNFDCSAPGGESPNDVKKRSILGVFKILDDANGFKTIAVIAHGRLLRILLSQLIHNSLHFMALILHSNTCVNDIDVLIFPSHTSWETPTYLTDLEPYRDSLSDIYHDLKPNGADLYFLHRQLYDIEYKQFTIDPTTPSTPSYDNVQYSDCYFYKETNWASVYGYKSNIYVFIVLKINNTDHLKQLANN
eukprot:NODE_271_length_11194_cov_0.541595.p4 type:complete len:292 gc:universal NODE_271_length_11194_cov_0.541595:3540-4415(+)